MTASAVSNPSDVLSIDEVAELLGVNPRTIQRWRQHTRKPLPAHRAPGGRRVYFVRDEVDRWLRGAADLPYRDDPRMVKRRVRSPREKKASRNGRGPLRT